MEEQGKLGRSRSSHFIYWEGMTPPIVKNKSFKNEF